MTEKEDLLELALYKERSPFFKLKSLQIDLLSFLKIQNFDFVGVLKPIKTLLKER